MEAEFRIGSPLAFPTHRWQQQCTSHSFLTVILVTSPRAAKRAKQVGCAELHNSEMQIIATVLKK
jgi:hypothetical protein